MRLIDVELFDSKYTEIKCGLGFEADEHISASDLALVTSLALDAIPTADAVDVVRCKDCYHRIPNDGRLVFGACYCGIHTGSTFWDTDYCSYGERI